MQKHITAVGVLNIGYNLLTILLGLFLLSGMALAGAITQDPTVIRILTIISFPLAGLFLVLSLPGLIGGIGLLMRKNWARYLVLIMSVLYLFNIPFGTALGVYGLWALVQDDTVALMGAAQTAAPA